jgi:hypothetical protein
VVIIGTDPATHFFSVGDQVISTSIRFAAYEAGKTGAYINLSCHYHNTAAQTPVPLLDAFTPGGFTVPGDGCFNDAHIVATHPALSGLTDSVLSNWGCSVHEAFDKWPDDFLVPAIARGIGASFTAPDGTTGTPHIVARGKALTVISDIKLAPLTATKPVGTDHTVTATITQNDEPVVGTTVTFTVVSGPHAGTTGTATTNAAGQAGFTYRGTRAGVDAIEAKFVDSRERTQASNRVARSGRKRPGPIFRSARPTRRTR